MISKRGALLFIFISSTLPLGAHAESTESPPPVASSPQPPPGDTISQGLWWLYQLQYEKARDVFDRYTASNPQDPSGYFYKAATDWWQLAQEFDFYLPKIEKRFENDYQDTVRVAKAFLNTADDAKNKGLACLYWGGAEGLKGRWLVTQKQWIKAYFLGKRGHRLLKKSLQYDATLYDAYLGLGIYDYFTDTLPGVQKVLADLFIHGDRKRGLQELQWAIEKGHRARVEAMIFLIEIYTAEENTPEKALPLTQQLRTEFPHSPAMHLAEVMALFTMKEWERMAVEAQSFLEKSEKEIPYYNRKGIRPARYCLGVRALYGRRDPDLCLAYMNQILGEGMDSSRWVTFAYLRRGQVYDLKGERSRAIQDYKTALSRKGFWGSHDEVHQYLKKPFSF